MNNSLLSICIPTFNRPGMLKNTIENLIKNIYSKDFVKEILIIDNSETNDSKDIVENYLKNYNKIRYIKNEINIGAEGNFRKGILESSGEYVWIIGDDDSLEECTKNILEEKFSQNFDCLITNFSLYDFNLENLLKHKVLKGSNVIYNDKNNILKDFGLRLSFISTIIFKKNLFESRNNSAYKNFEKYGLSFLVFVYSIFLDPKNIVFFEKESLVRQRGFNNDYLLRADKYYNVFAKGFKNVYDFLETKGYAKSAIWYSKVDSFEFFILRDLINRKINGDEFKIAFRYAKETYSDIFILKLILIIVYLIPSFLLNFLKNINRKIS